jgi:asparagine synthase (glutamine-hydrolysing)
MCGIAGIVLRRGDRDIGATLQRMGDALAHRGPDGQGFAAAANGRFAVASRGADLPAASFGLAHRRLAIIDLSNAAAQPMCDETGRRAISYNGEIYNYLELRKSQLNGQTLKSESDTEVLLRLLAERWTGALDLMTGMFAFAFADLERNKLLLARDCFGIKPLFYLAEPHRFAFASEMRPLLAMLQRRPTVDPVALHRFLRHAVTDADGSTFVAEICQIPAGHALELDLDDPADFRVFAWWQRPAAIARPMPARQAADELRELFLHSIRLHLRADIPVATTLSGGIDSSGIVAAVRAVAGDGATVHAFTYRADDAALDESHFADVAATSARVLRHDVRASADQLVEELDTLILSQEQPFSSTSIFAQAQVFRAVHEAGFKVAMDGQGSDELFAGYHVFRIAQLAALLRQRRFADALSLIGNTGSADRMLARAFMRLVPRGLIGPLRQMSGRAAVPDWCDESWFKHHGNETLEPSFARATMREELTESFWRTSLPMLLRYSDRNAMACSVENRVPFLTPDLVRFAASLPDELLIDREGTTKRVLRDALRGLVPDAILDRTDKIGFQTPEAKWLAQSPALQKRLGEMLPARLPGCFSPSFRRRAEQVLAGGHHDPAVWRGLCFIRWSELLGVEVPA